MGYKILLPQEIMQEGRDYLESRGHELITGSGMETEDIIRQTKGVSLRVASIGPAGENLVYAACIINDRGRAAGRCGLGAIMGSKNLKAIAVSGDREIYIADPVRLDEVRKKMLEKITRKN